MFMREDMAKRGVPKSYYAPPICRFVWACGVELTPPIFLTSKKLLSIYAIWFGLFFGLFTTLLLKWNPIITAPTAIFAGALFGWLMTRLIKEKDYKMPQWKDYGSTQHDSSL